MTIALPNNSVPFKKHPEYRYRIETSISKHNIKKGLVRINEVKLQRLIQVGINGLAALMGFSCKKKCIVVSPGQEEQP